MLTFVAGQLPFGGFGGRGGGVFLCVKVMKGCCVLGHAVGTVRLSSETETEAPLSASLSLTPGGLDLNLLAMRADPKTYLQSWGKISEVVGFPVLYKGLVSGSFLFSLGTRPRAPESTDEGLK